MKKFIRNSLVLLVILVSALFTYQHASPYLEKTFGTTNLLPYVSYRIEKFISPTKSSKVLEDTSQNSGHTFSKNTALVYVDLDNKTLYNASMTGLIAWNNTGAFNFKITNNKAQAQIIIKEMDDSSTNAAGLTNTEYNSLTGHLLKATVNLNSHYLLNPNYGYSNQRIVNTVEHELGHAIGLDHQKGVSVMYPEGSFYTIQPIDIQNVQKLYHEKVN